MAIAAVPRCPVLKIPTLADRLVFMTGLSILVTGEAGIASQPGDSLNNLPPVHSVIQWGKTHVAAT